MNELINKIGIVTGAARGLGASCARTLTSEGATVVLADRLEAELRQTCEAIGPSASAAIVDLRSEQAISDMIDHVVSTHGRLDFIVQNAAVQVEKPLHETSNDEWNSLYEVNLRAIFWGSKHALRHMISRAGGGNIINIGSVMSVASDPVLAAYSTMKHAVLGLTRSIATNRQYAQLGIRANCICPGDILTDMQLAYWAALPDPSIGRQQVEAHYPSGKIGTPEQVANIVAFLASNKASLLNGAELVVDGGRLPLYY